MNLPFPFIRNVSNCSLPLYYRYFVDCSKPIRISVPITDGSLVMNCMVL